MDERKRCSWIGTGTNNRMVRYHDEEWGFPVHDDRILFEFLILEGVQAGLSWQTVLNKREDYRKAFHNFDPEAVALFSDEDVARLLADPGIIRNRLENSGNGHKCPKIPGDQERIWLVRCLCLDVCRWPAESITGLPRCTRFPQHRRNRMH